MRTTLCDADLAKYVSRQVSNFFPDGEVDAKEILPHLRAALERLDYCFRHIQLKYFFDGSESTFNHLQTDQYAMFLYLLANTIHRRGGNPIHAGKVYALNKALHAIDVFYEVELPDIFVFQHAVGTVIGRAKFSDYFFIYQRCTIGANMDGVYPTLGEGIVMFGGSRIIGDLTVGNNCWLSVGATILDESIPDNSVVFGHSPHLVVKPTRRDCVREMFQRTGKS